VRTGSTASSPHSTTNASKSAYTPQQWHKYESSSTDNRHEGGNPGQATRATQHEANLRTSGRPRSRESRRRSPTSPSPAYTLSRNGARDTWLTR
jgi:hypothetical protein